MKERDCANCKHHTSDGCSSWDCEFEAKDLISRADAIETVQKCVVESELLADWNKAMESAQELLSALPSAETHEIRTETHGVCLISRADAHKSHEEEHLNIVNRIKELQYAIAKTQTIVGKMVESAEIKPTVIRSKTLLPTKDFKEWAKRVRETNPNVVVIPCDAEVVSADAVPQLKQTDTLIIADALRYLAKDTERHLVDRTRADALRQQFIKYGASMCKGGAE